MTGEIRFDGQVALVTGAASGLGRATAYLLARRGARVVLADRVDMTELVDEIAKQGGMAVAVVTDLALPETPSLLVATAVETWGRLDVLVCAAGFLRDRSFAKLSAEDFEAVVHIHLIAAAACARSAWPIMAQQGGGRILLFTSHAGMFGNFGQANYAAAKMGIIGLMQTLALEGERQNIRANAVAPLAATPMAVGTFIADLQDILHVGDVAAVAAYLCSTDAKVTGRIVSTAAGKVALAAMVQADPVEMCVPGSLAPEAVAACWSTLSVPSETPLGPARAVRQIIGQNVI